MRNRSPVFIGCGWFAFFSMVYRIRCFRSILKINGLLRERALEMLFDYRMIIEFSIHKVDTKIYSGLTTVLYTLSEHDSFKSINTKRQQQVKENAWIRRSTKMNLRGLNHVVFGFFRIDLHNCQTADVFYTTCAVFYCSLVKGLLKVKQKTKQQQEKQNIKKQEF